MRRHELLGQGLSPELAESRDSRRSRPCEKLARDRGCRPSKDHGKFPGRRLYVWFDQVVPLAVKLVAFQVDAPHLRVADFASGGVFAPIQSTGDFQNRLTASPIAGDKTRGVKPREVTPRRESEHSSTLSRARRGVSDQ
jgi:hypothetical protein